MTRVWAIRRHTDLDANEVTEAEAVVEKVAGNLQRRLRPFAPGLMAQMTWAWKRYRGERVLPVVDALISPGDAVVDIGANWGLYTARMTRLVGPSGQVDAFEPLPGHARTLRSLARGRPHVAVHSMALSDVTGEAQMHVPVVRNRAVTALGTLQPLGGEVDHEIVTVRVGRCDDVLSHRRAPSLVKCDVEGLELSVLRGAETTLRRSKPALVVEIEQRHQSAPVHETFSYLAELGYAGYFLGRAGLRPLEQFDVERHQLAPLRASAMDQTTPAEYVSDFLFVAPEFDVSGLR